eukprot:6911205-Prymnesium_polylepis.1
MGEPHVARGAGLRLAGCGQRARFRCQRNSRTLNQVQEVGTWAVRVCALGALGHVTSALPGNRNTSIPYKVN